MRCQLVHSTHSWVGSALSNKHCIRCCCHFWEPMQMVRVILWPLIMHHPKMQFCNLSLMPQESSWLTSKSTSSLRPSWSRQACLQHDCICKFPASVSASFCNSNYTTSLTKLGDATCLISPHLDMGYIYVAQFGLFAVKKLAFHCRCASSDCKDPGPRHMQVVWEVWAEICYLLAAMIASGKGLLTCPY